VLNEVHRSDRSPNFHCLPINFGFLFQDYTYLFDLVLKLQQLIWVKQTVTRMAAPVISVDRRPVNPKMPHDTGQHFPNSCGQL